MRRYHLYYGLVVFFFTACTPIRPAAPTPVAAPTVTIAVAIPKAPEQVTFVTSDGTTLTGTLYGDGKTALILSNMGDNEPAAWDAMAPLLAEQGYLVLTYKFRYPTRTSTFTRAMANQTVDDLQAAVAFVQERGAETLVLIGASLGGMATAKVAANVQPAAMIVLAAPADLPEFDFQVAASELAAITAPKLFIASQDDTNVPIAATQQMFELAAEPKEFQSYDSAAHGVQLLSTDHADDLRQRLIDFITGNAPANPKTSVP